MGDEVDAVEEGRLRVVALVERVAGLEARIAQLFAEQISVLSVLQVDDHVRTEGLDLVDELAPRLRWTSFTAARRLWTAARVAACFPHLWADLAGGELDHRRVEVVVREAELLDEEQASVLDAVLAGRLPGLTTAQITELVRQEIAVIDTDAVRERARRVVASRRVGFTALADGAALLEVVGPAPALRAVYDRLDALAKDTSRPGAGIDPYAGYPGTSTPADGTSAPVVDTAAATDEAPTPVPGTPAARARGIDAERFDAAVEMLLAPVHSAPGTATGTGPQITIAWTAATGLDDQPARLAGYGAVPAELVRHLLRDQGFRCVATDPVSGHAIAVDSHAHAAGSLPDLRGSSSRRSVVDGAVVSTSRPTPARSAMGLVPSRPAVEGDRRTDEEEWPVVAQPGDAEASREADEQWDEVAARTLEDEAAWPDSTGDLADDDGDRADRFPSSSGLDPSDVRDDVDARDPLEAGDPWDPHDRPDARDPSGADAVQDLLDPFERRSAERRAGQDVWVDLPDPSLPPRDDEFTVTLDISAFGAATLVDPHRVHDLAAWHRRARRRARTAVAACPASTDPARAYRFGAALRRLLLQRSPRCAAPGCRAPSHRCDLDHTVDHALGGPTCWCNAAPLCRRHHTAKHGAGWLVVRTHDDPRDPGLTWLSPLGYLYAVPSQPLLPAPTRLVAEHLQARRRAAAARERQLSSRPPLGLGGHRPATTAVLPEGSEAGGRPAAQPPGPCSWTPGEDDEPPY